MKNTYLISFVLAGRTPPKRRVPLPAHFPYTDSGVFRPLRPKTMAGTNLTVFNRIEAMTTQLLAARAGQITPEMEFVATREQLSPELIRDEVAAGRMVIPANKA